MSPYLTAYVLHVYKTAADLKYTVDAGVRGRAYDYLQRQLAAQPPAGNEEWWPSYTAWQAFAVKVLAEGGRNVDSHLTRLYGYRERMPVFALAYLHDALNAKGETDGDRVAELRRRLANAILPEGGSAHVEELADPYLLWFWNSNVRSTAIVLNSLVTAGAADAPLRQLVRWLMAVRKNGRWGNTQENAHAMEALVAYYRKYEATAPDFRAVVKLGARELARDEFRGRSTEAHTTRVPMPQVLAAGAKGQTAPLTFSREGPGTLYYAARLRYAVRRGDAADPRRRLLGGATLRAVRRARHGARRHRLCGRRSGARDADAPAHQGAPVRGRHRSAAGRLRGRRVVVRHHRQRPGGGAGSADQRRRRQPTTGRTGGATAASTGSSVTTIACSSSPPGSPKASTRSATSSAPPPPAPSVTAPTRAEEMYEPEVFGRTATTTIEVKR